MKNENLTNQILPNYLTPSQKDAVTYDGGPLLIAAGPGAGKTDTIVRRAAYLVAEGKARPEEVVVTTFTNKAAEELYYRLRSYLGNSAADMYITTIHSFCDRILRSYPERHPWGAGYSILDGREQFLFVYARLKDLGLSRFPKGRLGEFIFDVIAFFNLCTEEQVSIGGLQEEIKEKGGALLGLKKEDPKAIEEYAAVAKAYELYQELLQKEGLLDFSGMQAALYNLLQDDSSLCAELSKQYRYFLVDEYQDTNRLQVEILRLLTGSHGQVTAVGDEDQSIYRFRGATVSSFLRFDQDFPGAYRVELDVNFRSTPALVDASSTLIEHNGPVRSEKELTSSRSRDEAVKPVVMKAETCPQEAAALARMLRQWKEEGVIESYNHVVLLFRSVKYQAGEYFEALEKEGVPFYVGADGGFFDREDILQLKDLIKFCGWKKKWEVKCLQGKMLELSSQAVEAVVKYNKDPSTWTEEQVLEELGIKDQRERKMMMELGRLRERTTGNELNDLMELFYELLQSSGYFARCCSYEEEQGRQEWESTLLNLAQFSRLLDAFQRHVRTINTYRFGEYLRNIPQRSLDDLRPEPEEAVRLMTVHQAKGLEYPLVVIGSAMNGRFPQKFKRPRYPIPGKFRLSGEEESEEEHLYDQRRLFYVAMTRAEDMLVVGAPEKVNKRGGGVSRFAKEMGEDNAHWVESYAEVSAEITAGLRHGKDLKEKQPVRRIFYTALHSYLLCPLQYKLLYEYEFALPQAYYFRFGGTLHYCLEHLHKLAQKGEVVTAEQAEEIFLSYWQPDRSMSPETEEKHRQLGIKYLRQYVENYAHLLGHLYWVEENVEVPLGDSFICTGRIDLALKNEDGLEIIDFKARTRRGLDVLKPQYQLQAYALAVQENRQEKVDKLIIHLLAEEPGKERAEYPWNEQMEEETRHRLYDAVEGIREGRFEAQPGGHCFYCDFSRLCPDSRFKEKEQFNERIKEDDQWLLTMGMDP